jgi:signal transduction histidine kinase
MAPTPYPTFAAFRSLASALDDPLFIVDEWWRLHWSNPAGERLLAAASLPRDGAEFLALFATEAREQLVLDAAAGAAESWRGRGTLVGSELTTVSINVHALPAGVPPGWRAVQLVDRSAHDALEKSLSEARALERVGRLALALGHEFSELLTAIGGSAELLASELAPRDAVRADVEAIRLAAERAAVLTRALTRGPSSRSSAPQRVELSRAIEAMDATLRRTAGERVRLVLDLAPNAGQALIDLSQLEAAVLHLARNAREAMPFGGDLRVTLRATEVAVPRKAVHAIIRPGRYATIEVRDTGIGMPDATVQRCFEPLFSTRDAEGLGLSLVFGTLTQMGGYVTCDSAPALGTIMTLYIPAMAPSEVRLVEPRVWTRSVLVVDDEEAVRRIAARTLRREGYRVSEACDADQALALVSGDPSLADLLVTDVVMPGLSGVELASCIVAARPDVRVLFSSGASAMATAETARLPRGAAFLPKPFTPKALGDRVRSLFGL